MVQGLKENWKQFTILVVVNGFVGGVLGLERSVLPKLIQDLTDSSTYYYLFTLILIFGLSKALTNYFTGRMSQRFGRKKLLVVGWVLAIPVPLLLMYGSSWSAICIANIFLGISQGLTWSSTVIMKIDLVGEKRRGLALGLNESIGYLSLAISAFFTAWITDKIGIQPYPFYLGLMYVLIGLLLSIFFVRDTSHFVHLESDQHNSKEIDNVFLTTTYRDPNLSAITQGGIVNNLNDGMLWGVLPVLLLTNQFEMREIGIIVSVYPAVWGLGQLATGALSDRYSLKLILVTGMVLQACSLLYLALADSMLSFCVASVGLGIGTALVYPNFMVGIARNCPPIQRAECIGVYRLWRDLGYVFGAIISAGAWVYFGLVETILLVAAITLLSGFFILFRYRTT